MTAICAFALLVAGCSSGRPEVRSRPSDSGTTASGAIRRIHTGSQPCAVLGAAGAVWVADIVDNAVRRIDPATLKVGPAIPAGNQPCGMAFGAGAVWVEDYGGNTVTRIDPSSLATKSYPVGGSPYDVTFLGGAAWTSDYADGTVTWVDAASGKTRTIPVGSHPVGIAHSAGYVWVANQGSGSLTRIDATGNHLRTFDVGGQPSWTAYDGDLLWVGDQASSAALTVDGRSGKVLRRSTIGSTPNDGDVLAGSVWFPNKDGYLYRVDERTGKVAPRIALGASNPFTLAAYDGRLWIADFGGTDVLVVDPAKAG